MQRQRRLAAYGLAERGARARRLVSTNATVSPSLIILPRFCRWARTSARDSLNRTTLPSTMATAYMLRAYAKRPNDDKRRPEIRDQFRARRRRKDRPQDTLHDSPRTDTLPPHIDTRTLTRGTET